MATSKQVENALERFNRKLDRANDEIKDLIKVIRDLEKALETFNADEDLDVTRSIKSDIRRGKKEITELRKNIDKLERELKDTNRKYQYLAH
ncbi:MAG: hypothetical protein AAF846_10890 [Chloroflexota bacterium]